MSRILCISAQPLRPDSEWTRHAAAMLRSDALRLLLTVLLQVDDSDVLAESLRLLVSAEGGCLGDLAGRLLDNARPPGAQRLRLWRRTAAAVRLLIPRSSVRRVGIEWAADMPTIARLQVPILLTLIKQRV